MRPVVLLVVLVMAAACGDKPFVRPDVPPPIELKERKVGGLTRRSRVYRPVSLAQILTTLALWSSSAASATTSTP